MYRNRDTLTMTGTPLTVPALQWYRPRTSTPRPIIPYDQRTTLTMTGAPLVVPALVWIKRPPRYATRVRIKRGGEWVDITSRVEYGVIARSNDDPVSVLELALLNGEEYDSLAPRRKDSPLNIVDGQYAPLLDRYNEILVEAAVSYDGSEPTDFVPVFGGYLGDEIRTEHSEETGVLLYVTARDYAKRLQDDYIEHPITYRNMWASEVIQALLDERLGPGQETLLVYGVDDFWIEEVTFEFIDTWQAIQSFAEQSNKDIRYMLDESSGQIRLVYWTPDLSMAPVWTIEGKDILHEALDTSDASLRHRVIVRWIDQNGHRQETVAEDLSVKKPLEPVRTVLIDESETSVIRDAQAAGNFATAVLTALKTVPATDRLALPFNPYVQLYDVVEVTNPKVRSEPDLYAIEEMTLAFSVDEWQLEAVTSDSVKIRHNVWLDKEAKKGVNEPPRSRLLPPEDVQAVAEIENNELVIKVSWTPRTGVSLYEVRWRAQGDMGYEKFQTEETEYVIEDLPGGGSTIYPGSNTFPGADVYPLPATYEIGVLSISAFGRSSPVTTVVVPI